MRIVFNEYKGFLLDEDLAGENRIDVRQGLQELTSTEDANSDNSKKKTKAKKVKSSSKTVEFKTDGFDVLNVAMSFGNGVDETNGADNAGEDDRIRTYGVYLRGKNYQPVSRENNLNTDDLSSHTTLYGQQLLNDNTSASIETEVDCDRHHPNNNKKKDTSKQKKRLTPDERKDLRKQARESKKNAKLSKKQQKESENKKLTLNVTSGSNLTSFRSKIQYLKNLSKESIQLAKDKSGDTASDRIRVCQIDDVTLYLPDLLNLLDDEWLSDSNIGWVYVFLYNAYILPLLFQRLSDSKFIYYKNEKMEFVSPICLLLPTFTFLIANHPDPIDLVKCNVLPAGMSEAQFVFCPLNDNDDFGSSDGGSHWSLVVFVKLLSNSNANSKEYVQKALVFDSMFEANASETTNLVSNMAKLLYNPKDPKCSMDWDTIHVRNTPQQTNGSDCGVYVSSVTSVLISQLVALVQSTPSHSSSFSSSSSSSTSSYIQLSLDHLRFSAIDSRIWMMNTILNFQRNENPDKVLE